jgi:hypothetical protein
VAISSANLLGSGQSMTVSTLLCKEPGIQYSPSKPIQTVLEKLKNATAPGVTYESIDHTSYPNIAVDSTALLDRMLSPRSGQRGEQVYLVHGISVSDVEAYGVHITDECSRTDALLASFFFRRRGESGIWPADYRRLVPTIAYQICISLNCPRKLKTEILGALYMEPHIPEQALQHQFKKLLIAPLRQFAQDLSSTPVIIVLDSIHHCEDVKHIIIPIVQAMQELEKDPLEQQVNVKFVVTSVSYDYVLDTLRKSARASPVYYHILPNDDFIQRISFIIRNFKHTLPYTGQLFFNLALIFVLPILLFQLVVFFYIPILPFLFFFVMPLLMFMLLLCSCAQGIRMKGEAELLQESRR